MHIETFGPRRLRLALVSVPLELWIFLEPGHTPTAAWFDSLTGRILAEVPVVTDDRPTSSTVGHSR